MEELLNKGFHYTISMKIKKSNRVKDLKVFYYGIEIYHHILHININADIIFMNVCNEYKNNFIK